MKKLFPLLIMMAFMPFCRSNQTIAGEGIDISHYEIHLNEIDFDNRTIGATATITLKAVSAINSFALELKTLTVSNVVSSDIEVSGFSQSGDLLSVNLSSAMNVGSTYSFTISYGGNTFNEDWGGVHWSSDYVYNLGVGFDSQPHNLGKTWFPCVDDFTDKANYDVFVTTTNDKKAICGGNLVSKNDNGDGTSTWHWNTPQEIPTYLISFTIGDYELWNDTFHGMNADFPIEVYAKPNQINKVPGTFVNTAAIASFFEDCFGPYPLNRIGYISTPLGCMEHVDNIAFASSLITGGTNDGESFIAHEMSHAWFGDYVTCSTAGDMWLNEGFASFCGAYYLFDLYGEDAYRNEMNSIITNILSSCHIQEGWIPLNNMPLDLTYGTTVYKKGAIVVHSMMNYLGKDKFFEGIRHYLDKYAFSSATSEDLLNALNESTDVDMQGFFDTYVFTAGSPHFNIDYFTTTPENGSYKVDVYMKYKHRGAEHVGQHNIYKISFFDENLNIVTDTVCWNGLNGHSTKILDFEPIAVIGDYYNDFADAKLEKNKTFSSSGNCELNYFKLFADNINNPVFCHLENHLVGPDDAPETEGITLSSSHYWSLFRQDDPDADFSSQITFSTVTDGDIIHTENDSAVLLYRRDAADIWHVIPYTQEGTWKHGRFTVENPASGDYTVAAIDKSVWSVDENADANDDFVSVYNGEIHISGRGEFQIIDVMGRMVYSDVLSGDATISTSNIKAGIYVVRLIRNGTSRSEKMIIK